MTGFPQAVRELVAGRSGGLCEIRHPASCTGRVEQLHHRTPRGMGGSRHPAITDAANCLGVCAECHAFVESSREVAMWHGWLVSRCDVSATRPVLYRSRWVLLDAAGNVTEVADPQEVTG